MNDLNDKTLDKILIQGYNKLSGMTTEDADLAAKWLLGYLRSGMAFKAVVDGVTYTIVRRTPNEKSDLDDLAVMVDENKNTWGEQHEC